MRVARRSALVLLGSSAIVGLVRPARAGDKFVTVGINLPLTGASAEDATNILHGAQLAIEEANAKGGIGGYEIASWSSTTAPRPPVSTIPRSRPSTRAR